MIERLLDATQDQLLIPALFVTGLAWLFNTLFQVTQWRSRNRKEFLEAWESGDKEDDLWLEVVVRHLTGRYLPARIIRGLAPVPGKVDALLELGQAWPLLQIDARSGNLGWRKSILATRSRRRWCYWMANVAYFPIAFLAVAIAMYAASLPPTSALAWTLALAAVATVVLALRLLSIADVVKHADSVAPRWMEFFNSQPNHPSVFRSPASPAEVLGVGPVAGQGPA